MTIPDINELDRITIRCPGCSKCMRIPRGDYDPIRAAYFTIPCPQCDDGDFHEPHYFDCDDREILWEPEWMK